MSTIGGMKKSATHPAALGLLVLASLIFAGCTTTGGAGDEAEPMVIDAEPTSAAEPAAPIEETTPVAAEESKQEEGEVPLAVAESEQPDEHVTEVIVEG